MSAETIDPSIPADTFLIVNGARVYRLIKKTITIGRHTDNDIVIQSPEVSRYHIRLDAESGNFKLTDLDSTGGTLVNGEPVAQKILKAGDILSLAGTALIIGQGKVAAEEEPGEEDQGRQEKSSEPTLLIGRDADQYLAMFDINPKKEQE
jgi:pSer/pThr/pTyr-binding forkhead associated (FHA) protein